MVYAGSNRGAVNSSSKEVEARAILFAISKAREFQLVQLLILLDSLEVVQAIKGNEDLDP